MSWLKSQQDVHLLSISQANGVFNDLSANRFMQNTEIRSIWQKLPSFFLGQARYRYVESCDMLRALRLAFVSFYAIIAAFVIFIFFISKLWFFGRLSTAIDCQKQPVQQPATK
jgi:hypothetical protein